MSPSKKIINKALGERIGNYTMFIVSSAEPYSHGYVKDKIEVSRGHGGLVTAMEPILKLNGGTWIAHGRGAADKEVVDVHDHIEMPPNKDYYTLRRIWITKKNLKGWYYGFSNEALWPLCHNVFERPTFRQEDWDAYYDVNKQFADAVLQEAEGKTNVIVWVQDYLLALVPKMIRDKRPDLIVGHFWHIPWPVADMFKICPWDKETLEGMLGNQLIGFQRHSYCRHFLNSVAKTLEAKVDFDAMTVTYNNIVTYVRHFPISIDYKSVSKASEKSTNYGKKYIQKMLTARYEFLSLGVERVDYTKGLIERIQAIDRFLEKYPEYIERFVHINVLVPSRTLIKRYEDLSRELETLIENVNFKYATATWIPIHVIRESMEPNDIYSLCKSADIAMVTSLADGMNLVAKEYVTAGPKDGVLILSEQTGSADELKDALIVNPYDVEGLADAIKRALEMPEEERIQRIEKMREAVEQNDVFNWAGKFLNDLIDVNSHLDVERDQNGSNS